MRTPQFEERTRNTLSKWAAREVQLLLENPVKYAWLPHWNDERPDNMTIKNEIRERYTDIDFTIQDLGFFSIGSWIDSLSTPSQKADLYQLLMPAVLNDGLKEQQKCTIERLIQTMKS